MFSALTDRIQPPGPAPLLLALGILSISCPLAAQQASSGSSVGTENKAREQQVSEVVSSVTSRGILTTQGSLIVEPSFSYTHSSSTVVAIEGFTVLPALIIGLINISQAERDILTYALTFRYGITSRLEVSLRAPYLDIDESIRERQALDGTPIDLISDTSGDGWGDLEMSINYQLNDGGYGLPYFIGNLRIKSDSGTSIFDLDRRTLVNDQGAIVGVIFDEQPTGSGFWAVQPGLTLLYPSDPAVVYGSISYLWNIKDDKGPEFGGTVNPGDIIGFSFGMGFAVNERTSFSLGYEHNIIDRTTVEVHSDVTDAEFDRFHAGSLLFGLTQQVTRKQTINLSLAVGVTEQSPDVQITLKAPLQF
ncbi:transporter [Pseudomaricurvus sp. HS19]|uniref:transporter n=1 Tax=Pseudomaricurvus sp. HS19 TaxID=2692626 RepID=UPI00136A924A|nr:transporter [Pseudomaricurvus sp. HS19]MYM63403.1 transporter [Pseudomaricurvus sp. HS19]